MAELEGSVSKQLNTFVQQLERLEIERAELEADIRRLMDKADGAGFDTRIMRRVIKLKRVDGAEREGHESFLGLYRQAVAIGVHESWF